MRSLGVEPGSASAFLVPNAFVAFMVLACTPCFDAGLNIPCTTRVFTRGETSTSLCFRTRSRAHQNGVCRPSRGTGFPKPNPALLHNAIRIGTVSSIKEKRRSCLNA